MKFEFSPLSHRPDRIVSPPSQKEQELLNPNNSLLCFPRKMRLAAKAGKSEREIPLNFREMSAPGERRWNKKKKKISIFIEVSSEVWSRKSTWGGDFVPLVP